MTVRVSRHHRGQTLYLSPGCGIPPPSVTPPEKVPDFKGLFFFFTLQVIFILQLRVPNPPGANPLVAERAPLEVFAILSDREGVSSLLEIPTDSCHFFCTLGNPCVTPIVTRGEGPFSYQGVSTRGVRHAPVQGYF